jgi:hypothetical protein
MVGSHTTFSLCTKLGGPSIAKLNLSFPQYGLWMIFKGPIDIHQSLERFLSIINQYLNVSKSNRLHLMFFRFVFI